MRRSTSLARNVIGAALEVHRCLGPGLSETIYEQALCIELDLRRIPYRRQVGVSIEYKGRVVGTGRIDLLVADCRVVELKSTRALAPGHVTSSSPISEPKAASSDCCSTSMSLSSVEAFAASS